MIRPMRSGSKNSSGDTVPAVMLTNASIASRLPYMAASSCRIPDETNGEESRMRAANETQRGPSTRTATNDQTTTGAERVADRVVRRRRSESSTVGPSPVTLDGLPLMLTIAEAAVVLRVK